jgi:hypothetical protein
VPARVAALGSVFLNKPKGVGTNPNRIKLAFMGIFSSKNLKPDKRRFSHYIDALLGLKFAGLKPSHQNPIWNAAVGNRINLVLGGIEVL